MTRDESLEYWYPAARVTLTATDAFNSSKKLARALGYKYAHAGDWAYIELTPELRNTLEALRGPHRETMLKIYQIRRGLR